MTILKGRILASALALATMTGAVSAGQGGEANGSSKPTPSTPRELRYPLLQKEKNLPPPPPPATHPAQSSNGVALQSRCHECNYVNCKKHKELYSICKRCDLDVDPCLEGARAAGFLNEKRTLADQKKMSGEEGFTVQMIRPRFKSMKLLMEELVSRIHLLENKNEFLKTAATIREQIHSLESKLNLTSDAQPNQKIIWNQELYNALLGYLETLDQSTCQALVGDVRAQVKKKFTSFLRRIVPDRLRRPNEKQEAVEKDVVEPLESHCKGIRLKLGLARAENRNAVEVEVNLSRELKAKYEAAQKRLSTKP